MVWVVRAERSCPDAAAWLWSADSGNRNAVYLEQIRRRHVVASEVLRRRHAVEVVDSGTQQTGSSMVA